jgi:hypothetical protein
LTILPDGRRRCSGCATVFATTTGTGTIGAHLRKKHGISKTKEATSKKQYKQTGIDGPTSFVSQGATESAIATYIVSGVLSHNHVESVAFKEILSTLAPAVTLFSAQTLKRRVLVMYIVLKTLIAQYLAPLTVAFSVTYDGWSNDALRGYYSTTLHWISTDLGTTCDCILDFFFVTPGPGVGERCGSYLISLLDSFGIISRVLAVVSDNGGDAVVAGRAVVIAAAAEESTRLPTEHVRCFAHTFQLAIRCITDAVAPSIASLRSCLSLIRGSKTRRALFRTMSAALSGEARSPPCLDSATRWNSTHNMVKQSLALRATIAAVANSDDVYTDFRLDASAWETLADIEKFLRLPAKISTELGASKVCTMSLAHGANKRMIEHCNSHVNHVNSVVAQASQAMLANLIQHRNELGGDVPIIAKFLDLRAARDARSVDFRCDQLVVQRAMALPRYASSVDYTAVHDVYASTTVTSDSEDDEFAINLFGTSDAGNDVEHELTRYALQPQLDKSVDVIKWWALHKPEYPILYTMAMDYLAAPATSVPSERANSSAKHVFHGRHCLSDCMFKAEICCQSWLRLAGYIGLELPVDYDIELERIKSVVDLDEMAKDDIVVQYYLDN